MRAPYQIIVAVAVGLCYHYAMDNAASKKNDIVTVTVDSLGINGEGVARLDSGMAVFVTGALKGETVRIKLILVKKNFAIGKLIEVITPSQDRVAPKCPVFGKCGGCALQHLKYESQTGYKSEYVKDTLARVGGVECEVVPCVPSDKYYAYRNKIQLPVTDGGTSGINIGFFRGGSHDVVDIERCDLHEDWADKLIATVRQFARLTGAKGYNEISGKGLLRHIVARFIDGKIVVCVVINARELTGAEVFSRLLSERFGTDWGLYTSVNTARTNVIMGAAPVHISGLKTLDGFIGGVKYSVRIESFLQVNEAVAEKIYTKAVKLASGIQGDIIIDAYSGIGILTAMLSKTAKAAVGIEIVEPATKDADATMRLNGIDNVINITGDCGELLPRVLDAIYTGGGNPNAAASFVKARLNNTDTTPKVTVVLDPARKGCDQPVLDALLRHPVDNIIYISCNPATLSRDVGILRSGYTVTYAQAYDMFPQTPHVETVVLMSRVDK